MYDNNAISIINNKQQIFGVLPNAQRHEIPYHIGAALQEIKYFVDYSNFMNIKNNDLLIDYRKQFVLRHCR